MKEKNNLNVKDLTSLEYFNGDDLAASVFDLKYRMGQEKNPIDRMETIVNEIAEKELHRTKIDILESVKINMLSDYGKKRYSNLFGLLRDKREPIIKENLKNYISFEQITLGGSMLQGIGNHKLFSSLSNCFVLGEPHDSYSGINAIEDELSNVGKRRGGAGISLDNIRPNGAKVHNQASYSSGVVLFAEGYSNKCKQVAQQGRRGALMLSLNILHPDSLEFIESKQDLTKITGANISVAINNDFMNAVENGLKGKDDTILLRFPLNSEIKPILEDKEYMASIAYNELISMHQVEPYSPQYIKKIHALEYWNKIIECAWNTAEPGILFIGNWELGGIDWVYPQYRPVSTNPCVSGNTMLKTLENGYLRDIRIDSKVGEKIVIWNGKKWSEVEPKITGYNQEMLRITCIRQEIGSSITEIIEIDCTKYHNWPIENKLKQAKDVIIGDILDNFLLPVPDEKSEGAIKTSMFSAKVIDIKPIENAKIVYCFSEPEEHKGLFNGIILGNCSEIPMQPYDACRLLANNTYSFVKLPFTNGASIDLEEIYKCYYEQMTIGDLIVDLEFDYIERIIDKIQFDPIDSSLSEDRKEYIQNLKNNEIKLWRKISDTAKNSRRVGCGFTALADMLAALNLPYYSPQFLQTLFKIKLKAELDATIDMAILFGTFKDYSTELEENSAYIQNVIKAEFPEQYERMRTFGRRNLLWSTAAPVGTGSIMTQSTSGIEPLFAPWYKRRKKCITDDERVDYIDPNDGQKFTEFFVMHPKFIEWFQIQNKDLYPTINDARTYLANSSEDYLKMVFNSSPWFGSTANDLNWKQRVEIQSIVQRYTTHAISSTINLPEDVKKSVISNIYFESWKKGLKGNTVYRDNCRSGVLVNETKNENKIKQDYIATSKRPISLKGYYHSLRSNKINYSIIIGTLFDLPYEIFIISGIDNLPEILGDMNEYIEGEIVRDAPEWYNFVSPTFTVKEISDSEGQEKLLSLTLSALMRNGTPMKKIIKIINKTKPIAGSFSNKLMKILSTYLPENETDEKERCPECGSQLKHENGCISCSCGWTKC